LQELNRGMGDVGQQTVTGYHHCDGQPYALSSARFMDDHWQGIQSITLQRSGLM